MVWPIDPRPTCSPSPRPRRDDSTAAGTWDKECEQASLGTPPGPLVAFAYRNRKGAALGVTWSGRQGVILAVGQVGSVVFAGQVPGPVGVEVAVAGQGAYCLLYTSPSPR